MDFCIDILRQNPVIALFLTVGLGFMLGRLKYKNFSLGPVTSVLIVAIFVGQLGIELSSQIKTVFFMLFLFAVGYSVGPQFFRSLKGMGLKQVLFAFLMSACCFGATFMMAKIMGYNQGETVGMFSGSQTCSSLLAIGGDAIGNAAIPDSDKQAMINIKEAAAQLESEMNEAAWKSDPVNMNALRTVAFRAFRMERSHFRRHHTVHTVEEYLRAMGKVVFIDRVRRADGTMESTAPDTLIGYGDTVVVCGRREFLIENTGLLGPEVNDPELLEYPVERIPVLVTSRKVDGCTVGQLRDSRSIRGIMIEELKSPSGHKDLDPDTVIRRGDTLVLIGRKDMLRSVSAQIGVLDVPTTRTDIMFLGIAIAIGAFLGAIPLVVDGVSVSFGVSGGSLIAGLVFGWLRTRRPTVGYIPAPALWLMNNLGLNTFIAVIGIQAAPTFVQGISQVGWGLLGAGAVATLIPLLIGLLAGRYIFRFNPAITLGCCAGTRTCTAALGAVQETIGSNIPTMGYTVTYAVSNVLLVIWGIITVALI